MQRPTDLERRALWRRRAEKARVKTREAFDSGSRESLLEIARLYEAMADRAATAAVPEHVRRPRAGILRGRSAEFVADGIVLIVEKWRGLHRRSSQFRTAAKLANPAAAWPARLKGKARQRINGGPSGLRTEAHGGDALRFKRRLRLNVACLPPRVGQAQVCFGRRPLERRASCTMKSCYREESLLSLNAFRGLVMPLRAAF